MLRVDSPLVLPLAMKIVKWLYDGLKISRQEQVERAIGNVTIPGIQFRTTARSLPLLIAGVISKLSIVSLNGQWTAIGAIE